MTVKNDEVTEIDTPPTAESEDELKWDRDRVQQLSDLMTWKEMTTLEMEALQNQVSELATSNSELNEQLAALKSSISEASKAETPEQTTEITETSREVETIDPASPLSESAPTEVPPKSEDESPAVETAPVAPAPPEPPVRKIQVV